MPTVVKIEPKDVHVTIDFSIKELRLLMEAISMSVIKIDGKDDDQKEVADFFNEFYDFLFNFFDKVKKDGA